MVVKIFIIEPLLHPPHQGKDRGHAGILLAIVGSLLAVRSVAIMLSEYDSQAKLEIPQCTAAYVTSRAHAKTITRDMVSTAKNNSRGGKHPESLKKYCNSAASRMNLTFLRKP